jgi:signal transduction histidine kinase
MPSSATPVVVEKSHRSNALSVASHQPAWWAGSPRMLTLRCRKRDGTPAWPARPIAHAGRPHLVLVSRDVTERLALEERLREARRHESLSLMAGGIAHDFNNLLTVVLGEAQLARAGDAEGRPLEASLDQIAAPPSRPGGSPFSCSRMRAASRARSGIWTAPPRSAT